MRKHKKDLKKTTKQAQGPIGRLAGGHPGQVPGIIFLCSLNCFLSVVVFIWFLWLSLVVCVFLFLLCFGFGVVVIECPLAFFVSTSCGVGFY